MAKINKLKRKLEKATGDNDLDIAISIHYGTHTDLFFNGVEYLNLAKEEHEEILQGITWNKTINLSNNESVA